MEDHSCVAKRTRSQNELYYEHFFEMMKNTEDHSCVARRTRSQKELYYNQYFFEIVSLSQTSRKRKRSASRVCVPKNSVLDVDDDKSEVKGSNDTVILSSNGDDITSFGPQTPKTELEVDGGIDQLLISSDTDIDDTNSDQSLTSSDTDNDDPNDEDFDADNYDSSFDREECSSSSEEYEEEHYDIDDEEEEEGSDNVKKRSGTPASKRRACSGERNQIKLDFSVKKNLNKNGNQLDGVDEEAEERISNFKGDESDKQELGEEEGSWKAKESCNSIDIKQARASEDYDIKGKGKIEEEQEIAKQRSFRTCEQRKRWGQKKHGSSTSTSEVKCDKESNRIFRENEKKNNKFNGDGADNEQLVKENEDGKEGESRKSTKTKQARVKSSTSTSEVKCDKESNGIFRENGKSNNKLNGDGADNEQLVKENEDWKEGESRKSTKTKQARVKEDNDIEVKNNDDGLRKREKKSIQMKRLRAGYDIFRILADSILDKEKAFECVTHEQECKPLYTLPLKFKFEDEEPQPIEKSDFEKMVDNLFDEMNFALKSEEIGNFYPAEDNDKTNILEAETNQTTLCRIGKHQLVLDEEIGLRCLHCSHVYLESKYVLPPFRKYTAKASERENYIGGKDFFMFDKFDFEASRDNFKDPFNHTKGTVWDIIPGVRGSMYLHQQEGFEFLWKNLAGTINLAELKSSNSSEEGGCIISHAPGTGKTRLTIIFLKTYLKLFPNCRPVIIAPASMLLTWEEEFRKWKVEYPFHNLNNLEFSGKENKTALRFLPESKCQNKDAIRMVKMYSWSQDKSFLGVSYSLYDKLAGERVKKGKGKKQKKVVLDKKVERWRKMLFELPDLVVLDEGHTPRNHRSCIWNTLLKLKTERRIILSGTPFQNNFVELFNTLRLVRSAVASLLAKEKTFADMISIGKDCRKKFREERGIASGKVVDDAIERLKATIAPFVHVHKGTILQESLPGLRDSVVLLNPPQLQKHLIARIEGPNMLEYEHKVALLSVHPSLLLDCSLSDKEDSIIDHDTLQKLRLNPDKGVKTTFVMELIRLSVAMNEKVLIFSQYIDPLELIKDQLREVFGWDEEREVLHMHGKLDQKHRQNMINVFNCPKSDAKVLLASIKCCSEGINLVGASRVVLLDVVWNPSVKRQAISRAYRLGQKRVVYTYHLMTSGTTEGDKYCRQAKKDRLSELVFSPTNKEKDKETNSTAVFNDKILDEMIGHKKLKDIFEKIIYQPKETDLIETFGLSSLS